MVLAKLAVDLGKRIGGQDINGHVLVPHYVQPVAEILPLPNWQLNEECLVNGRLGHRIRIGKGLKYQPLHRKAEVGIGYLQADDGFKPHHWKRRDKLIAFSTHGFDKIVG